VTRTPLSRSKGLRSTCILWRPPAQLVDFILVAVCGTVKSIPITDRVETTQNSTKCEYRTDYRVTRAPESRTVIFGRRTLDNNNNNNNNNNILSDLGRRISSMVTPERLVICISDFRCWYSVSMLFCYTTACRSLTARTEHHTLSVYFRQFLNLPRDSGWTRMDVDTMRSA